MIKKLKMIFFAICGLFLMVSLTSCLFTEDAVQHNIVQDIENYKTYRRMQFINVRSDKVLMDFEGYLTSKLNGEGNINIIIMTGPDTYQLHYVRVTSYVMYISEQISNTTTDPYHWEINVYAIIPDITWHA